VIINYYVLLKWYLNWYFRFGKPETPIWAVNNVLLDSFPFLKMEHLRLVNSWIIIYKLGAILTLLYAKPPPFHSHKSDFPPLPHNKLIVYGVRVVWAIPAKWVTSTTRNRNHLMAYTHFIHIIIFALALAVVNYLDIPPVVVVIHCQAYLCIIPTYEGVDFVWQKQLTAIFKF